MNKSVIALTTNGWNHVQLYNIFKLEKNWKFEGKEYKAEAYFGKLANQVPTIIMNVFCQGAGTEQIVDDNCDVWKNMFTSTTKDEGNEFFKYLKKHGFC